MSAHEDISELVEVAVPLPLRRTFTYRLPEELRASSLRGARVAVPFARTKTAGIVLSHPTAAPEGVTRLFTVAGVVDDAPLFTDELLGFLVEAADYYVHPIGEVLRAAAPAVPTGGLRRLRRAGFLAAGETVAGRAVGGRTVLYARALDAADAPAPRGRSQRAVLELLRSSTELAAADLAPVARNPRAVLRALAKLGLVALEERPLVRDPLAGRSVSRDIPPPATAEQTAAIERISAALRDRVPSRFLLHGVTGSGKTEVYLRAIEVARTLGRGAIVLVPEIALTPQLVARFRARFGDELAVLHSGLSDRDRNDAWWRLRRGDVRVAIGARSALFAPVVDLGILVVDEEHDPSFKQEEGFRYHARDMALLRAHRAGAVVVLGSATPAIETYHLAERGKIERLVLSRRAAAESALPAVEIVDLRRNRSGPSGHKLLSAPLHRALERCLEAGDQAILFLNRRGFAPSLRCEDCGVVIECPSCSVALTEHRAARALRCHYCDHHRRVPERCGACGSAALERLGTGTESLEASLGESFPSARIGRLDRDTVVREEDASPIERLRRRELDVLVGTQMVTKGHDLPGVTLVGVVIADQSLAFPDFRATERTFQLLAQVAGRAGRGERAGRVLFQTFMPDHAAVRLAAAHDYVGFYRSEIVARRELAYSPFSRLVAVRIDAGDEDRAREASRVLADAVRSTTAVSSGLVSLLGPAPAPIARVRSRYRYRILLRSADRRALRSVTLALLARIDEGLGPARATIDVDPVSML